MTNTEENDVKTPQVGDIHRFFDNEEEIGQAVCYETESGVAWSVRAPDRQGHERVLGEVGTLEEAGEAVVRQRSDVKRMVLAKATPGLTIYARHRTANLMDEQGLTVEQAVAVAHLVMDVFQRGQESGERNALYDRTPEGFAGGEAVRTHKVRDLRVVEFVPTEGKDHRFTSWDGRPGMVYSDFDGALVEAIGRKHDGESSEVGLFANRAMGIEAM